MFEADGKLDADRAGTDDGDLVMLDLGLGGSHDVGGYPGFGLMVVLKSDRPQAVRGREGVQRYDGGWIVKRMREQLLGGARGVGGWSLQR